VTKLQAAATRAWQQVRDAMAADELAYLRRRGLGGEYDTPPRTCRASYAWNAAEQAETWEFWTVERQDSDLPGYSRWMLRRRSPGLADRQPARVYLEPDATTEDAWRRFFLERYADLVRFDTETS